MQSGACDIRRLDRFLHQRPAEDFPADLEAHLLVCPACRDKLDELAGGFRWWTDVRKYLGGDGASQISETGGMLSPPPPTMSKNSPSWPGGESMALSGIDLSFLQPSEDSASLGRLGAYEVLEILGQGGMGIVLKAFDAALHRPVAIKVLASEFAANGAARKRFAREAKAAAAVVHDHVVPIHAVDPDATPPYLVMALIPGRSLQQRIDQTGPLELKEILRIGMQTASGLAAAHAKGLVHRDIKPANIMLENGVERVRITDFGLARAVDDSSVTQDGVLTGTPQYMAPEQARAETVDQRADLFSLGSLLYAMSTGRPPFRGDSSAAVVRQVCDTDPAPIRCLNPDIPSWMEGVIRKLHAKDQTQRFQTATEVADLLEQCLAHVQQPEQHRLPDLAAELGREMEAPSGSWPLRHWRAPLAAALMLLLLVGIAFILSWSVRLGGSASRESELLPELDPQSLAFMEKGLGSGPGQLRNRLKELEQSFRASPFDERNGLEPNLYGIRLQAESLQRDLQSGSEPGVDPVETRVQVIRQQLEQLRQNLGRPLE